MVEQSDAATGLNAKVERCLVELNTPHGLGHLQALRKQVEDSPKLAQAQQDTPGITADDIIREALKITLGEDSSLAADQYHDIANEVGVILSLRMGYGGKPKRHDEPQGWAERATDKGNGREVG